MRKDINPSLYQFLFEKSFDAILLTGPDGRIYRANAAACALFERSEEEICRIGRAGLVDIHDPRLQKALDERAKTGQARAELTYFRKDGTTFPGEATSVIFTDAQGQLRTAMIIRDMTHYKAAELLLRRAQEEAAYYANYDDLTGILNRRCFVDKLSRIMATDDVQNFPLCLLLADIDRFKSINDTYGHPCGDLVLKRFSDCLLGLMRPKDILGRYGGDEFIVCLPSTPSKQALAFAERLRGATEMIVVMFEGQKITFTASFGLACCSYVDGKNVDSLIRRVDRALYDAKSKRNCVCAALDELV
jgi:diguanylate cyclase (GGDEF)-like protein/PAS domain S-box-containing protein